MVDDGEDETEFDCQRDWEDERARTAEMLAELKTYDRTGAYQHFMEGALGSARSRVPLAGYGADALERADAFAIIDDARKYWIAHDLQMTAQACRQMLRRPTGIEMLDGEFSGHLARAGSGATAFDRQVVLLRRVAVAYSATKLPAVRNAPNFTLSFGSILRGGSYLRCAMSFAARRDLPANDALVRELESHESYADALAAEIIWRKEHGGNLEDFLDQKMRHVERWLPKWGHEITRIRSDPKLRNERLVSRVLPVHPLALLYLACERAVSCSDTEGSQFPERDRQPKLTKSQVQRVRRLFFALRFALIRDANSIPNSLQKDAILLHGEVLRSDGSPFPFEEVLEAELERTDYEAFSTNFSTRARTFAKLNRAHEAVASSWGAIHWRLQQ